MFSSITTASGNPKDHETAPVYNRAPNDGILESKDKRAQVVCGGDRTSDIGSGNGGIGIADSAAIDIVVGRGKSILRDDIKKISDNEM